MYIGYHNRHKEILFQRWIQLNPPIKTHCLYDSGVYPERKSPGSNKTAPIKEIRKQGADAQDLFIKLYVKGKLVNEQPTSKVQSLTEQDE